MLSESEMLDDTRINDNRREIVTAAGPSPPVQLGCAGGAMVGCFGLTGLHFIVLSDVARTASRSAVGMVRIAFPLDCCDREAISWVTTTAVSAAGISTI